MSDLSYFEVGDRENPVVSNSSLSRLNPEQGGSIVKFLNFFNDEEKENQKKESTSLTNGKLVHAFIENPETFVVQSNAPTDMMRTFLDKLSELSRDIKVSGTLPWDIDASVTSDLKTEKAATAEKLQLLHGFEKLGNVLGLTTDQTIKCFRAARTLTESYKSKRELTLLQDITPDNTEAIERKYLNFLLTSAGKHVLKPDDYKDVTGMCNSLTTHKAVSKLLGLQKFDEFDDEYEGTAEVFKEKAIYWTEFITTEEGRKIAIKCKALLDRLKLNMDKKKITYVDLKSTKSSVYLFQSAFEYYRYYRQIAWYNRAINIWFKAYYPDLNFSDFTVENYIVPVENQGTYSTGIYNVSQPWIIKGKAEAKALLERYAWHKEKGEYIYAPEEIKPDGSYKCLEFKNPE